MNCSPKGHEPESYEACNGVVGLIFKIYTCKNEEPNKSIQPQKLGQKVNFRPLNKMHKQNFAKKTSTCYSLETPVPK